jgi:hypothetical protein
MPLAVHLLSKLSRNLGNLLHCNTISFDSFSLGARHLFQNVVLFKKKNSYMRLHMSCHTLLFSE